MLNATDNALLTQTGPGTAMGGLFRRFWIPVLLSQEVAEPDCPPVRVTILGQDLVAFRDTSGRVGLVDPRCPHRGADLFFGRNEECGIRCVYHGWKFTVDGDCADLPTFPRDAHHDSIRSRIRLTTYPTREWGDFVWAYLGTAVPQPELPALELALVPPAHRFVSKKLQQCNWAQAAEGGLDTAHFSFLHSPVARRAEDLAVAVGRLTKGYAAATMSHDQIRWMRDDGRPRYTAVKHTAGLLLGASRKADGDDLYWRVAQYLLPCHGYAPGTAKGENYHGQSWVPIDDESCWVFCYTWNPERPLTPLERSQYREGGAIHSDVDARWEPRRHRGNDYLIDRAAQKTESYTGIRGISEQDACIQESQGVIVDRSRELLGPTDAGVVQFRRLMLDTARALAEGRAPLAASCPEAYRVRSGAIVAASSMPFPQVMVERFGDPIGRCGGMPEAGQPGAGAASP
jgi:phthalate 4,5-dioxygenase oxygenase subunit